MATPIILDCDPGTDDAIALLLALQAPELGVLAVTVAGGNVGLDRTLANARSLVALAGSRVPVYGGADRPLLGSFVNETRVHGVDGLGGIALPAGDPVAPASPPTQSVPTFAPTWSRSHWSASRPPPTSHSRSRPIPPSWRTSSASC